MCKRRFGGILLCTFFAPYSRAYLLLFLCFWCCCCCVCACDCLLFAAVRVCAGVQLARLPLNLPVDVSPPSFLPAGLSFVLRSPKQAPTFLTVQVSRDILNGAIRNLNAYAAPRLSSPSELLLSVDEISAIIDQGNLSRTLLLSAAHLKRVEVRGTFPFLFSTSSSSMDRADHCSTRGRQR